MIRCQPVREKSASILTLRTEADKVAELGESGDWGPPVAPDLGNPVGFLAECRNSTSIRVSATNRNVTWFNHVEMSQRGPHGGGGREGRTGRGPGWLALRVETGGSSLVRAVRPKSKLNEHREKITAAIQASPSLTLEELRAEKEL